MDLIDIVQKFGVEHVGRYYSIYRGIVISAEDVEGTGNIEVLVPSVGNITTIARPKSYVGGINHGMKYISPKPGDIVMVEFEKGNPATALWSYSSWGIGERPEELDDPDTLGIITPSGNKIYLKDKDGKLIIKVDKEIDVEVDNGSTINVTKNLIELNKGENRGIVNIKSLEELVIALQADLLIARSGANLSNWMATHLPIWEDKKVTH